MTRLLRWVLRRASCPEHLGFAARILPRLEGAIPRTETGAEFVRSSCADPHWAARYVAARSIGRMAPDLLQPAEVWDRLLELAEDHVAAVREGVPFGLAEVVRRCPTTQGRLERLIVDTSAPARERKAALRSLVILAIGTETSECAERLLSAAARAGGRGAAGVGPVIIGRGIGRRDPERALRILAEWSAGDDPVLREQAARALRRPLVDTTGAQGSL
jgi:hypothetical protein